jgi:hypothetical protein
MPTLFQLATCPVRQSNEGFHGFASWQKTKIASTKLRESSSELAHVMHFVGGLAAGMHGGGRSRIALAELIGLLSGRGLDDDSFDMDILSPEAKRLR